MSWVANELVCDGERFYMECVREPPEWFLWWARHTLIQGPFQLLCVSESYQINSFGKQSFNRGFETTWICLPQGLGQWGNSEWLHSQNSDLQRSRPGQSWTSGEVWAIAPTGIMRTIKSGNIVKKKDGRIWVILRCWGNSSILCQQNSDAL